jgi:hypothetical protein
MMVLRATRPWSSLFKGQNLRMIGLGVPDGQTWKPHRMEIEDQFTSKSHMVQRTAPE